MALEFELAGSQIDGARDYQEDAFLITHLTDAKGQPSALIVVADGMGGHAAGNVASNMAVQAFNKHVSSNYPTDDIPKILRESVEKANDSIKETVAETAALSGMGCTMVAAILEEGRVWWASVGDSHLYIIREKKLSKKNDDHSYGGYLDRMAAKGEHITPEKGLSRNMLMSALTGDEINEVDVSNEPFFLASRDKVILCSDGLDSLKRDVIIKHASYTDDPKECAEALMHAVEEAGVPKQDNTTAVVVNVKHKTIKADPTTTTSSTTVGNDGFAVEDTPEKSGGGFGKLIGMILVLGIAAAGAYFMLSGSGDSTTTDLPELSEVETDTSEESELAVEEELIEEAETDETVAVEEEASEETIAEEKPVETPEPAPSATSGKVIQDSLSSGGKGPEMMVVPGGDFQMGSTSSRYNEERPRHNVKVKSFAVSKYEITFEQYYTYAEATGKRKPDNLYLDISTHPVVFISWDDAYNYTKWLSKETGKRYRLASEAEWEYMASTGKKTPFWWGYDEEPNRAHCFGCGSAFDPRKQTKIGSFKPNAFGIYDTAGNVAEWVHDCWHDNYKDAPSYAEVWEGGDCSFRVARGGAFSSPPQSLRNQRRDKFKSDKLYDHIGIRVVRDLN